MKRETPTVLVLEANPLQCAWISQQDAGGILSVSPDKWYLDLSYLVLDGGLRNKLACAGKEDARARKMGHLACLWPDMIVQAANMNISIVWKPEKI